MVPYHFTEDDLVDRCSLLLAYTSVDVQATKKLKLSVSVKVHFEAVSKVLSLKAAASLSSFIKLVACVEL